ncbi:MAG TPA: SDR family NAD(P)-dependent oxidoreductase, partial [Candidatus Baltobacteraceae bacterium]|nr:SDR family NAD(P)-dependent oxidoreductase [Candidatus Baltobacteraceae bacterium]
MFEGKVGLVTGASRGIGRAIAADLARHGADIVLAGRDEAALNETAAACARARAGANTLIVTGDVAAAPDVERTVAKALETFGRVDFAIANAGQSVDSLLLRLKPDVLERTLAVNLNSAFYLCSAVAKPMMKQRSGSIVLMSSIVGLTGNAGQAAYAAAKAGLLGLTKS